MSILEMKNKRMQMFENCKKFAKEHANENGILNAEDKATYTSMENEIKEMTDAINRVEREEEMEKNMKVVDDVKVVVDPVKDVVEDPKVSDKVVNENFMKSVKTGFKKVYDTMTEADNGSYVCPPEFEKKIVKKQEDDCVVRKLATVIKTETTEKINVDDTPCEAAWTGEGESIDFTDATFSQVEIGAHKLMGGTKMTNELLEDNQYDLEERLCEQLGESLANKEEDAFLNGDGNNKPKGMLVDAEVAKTLSSASVDGDDILDLIYSVKSKYRRNGKFLVNDDTILKLRKLKDEQKQYMWQPSLQEGQPDRLYGYPVYTSPFMPKCEAGKAFIAFGNFKYYKIGDRGNKTIKTLGELYAANDMTAFVVKERVDGKLTLKEAVKVLKVAGTSETSDEESNS